MPVSRYDEILGGKGSAEKTLAAMIAKYGPEKGKAVFYATVNKKRRGDRARTR